MIPNDKLKITPQDVLSLVIATAATALCVAIDIILREENDENHADENTT